MKAVRKKEYNSDELREILFAYEKSFESENVSDADLYQTIDNFLNNY